MKTVRIETYGSPLPKKWQFFLGDIDISSYVSEIHIGVTVNDLPDIRIKLAGQLELPDGITGIITTFNEGDE